MNYDDDKETEEKGLTHKHALISWELDAKFLRYKARTRQTFVDFVKEKIKELPD